MNRQKSFGLLLIVVLFLMACSSTSMLNFGATETPSPTATPVVTATPLSVLSVRGTIGEQQGRKVTLCQIMDGATDLPADCTVYDQAAVTDSTGAFLFYDVPAGSYFVLYDNESPEAFDEGFEKWSGQTLKLGDQDWLKEQYYDPDAEATISMPVGTPLSWMKNPAYLYTYNFFVLHISGPFALAHHPQLLDKGSIIKMVHPVVLTVKDGITTETEITAYR